MNRDDILRMAREAGFICLFPDEAVNGIGTIYDSGDEEITEMMERFAALVAAAEREACAQMCDVLAWNAEYGSEEIKIAALAIRERGEANG
jgi:hypothetical protein